ncbi:ATP-binding cassette domain-containing protein [Yanghanlia caeni]|uniref:ABC transporter ATP-binding protein n=1 Tax=Yanghanlia caeni TaxID=3064283 RepID=A0ABU1D254_9BURK|nr:ABC transporter ATP-binding protein [Alcaligenaceae bacterium LG-2]NGR06726.1 ABC transporter ATP-binding protein [bacterium SGD-2]HZH55578.1 ABC transporter ATP-binding protein [Burkholderiaceae bacterium]
MTALLSLDNVYAGYGHSRVLHGMSLHVNAGEFVTLLGRNGMGKSTTVKCMVGLLRAQSGTLHLDGRDITRSASHQIARSGIGLVPEGRQIFPNLSVEENLLATARVPKATRSPWNLARVYELFPRLQERRSNPGTRLSGGEQQMLAIGRALMTNPRLLILDEATEGLAPLVRRDIWQALAMLKQTGLAILCIDKNLTPMLPLADRHYIVEKGRVAWQGTSEDYLAQQQALQPYLGL